MEFNERLRVSRKEKGLTQVDLAEKAGIAVNSVRLYESGKVTPKLDAMRKLADALEIDINWLLNGFTLKEHDEEFIQRLQGKGDVSARDLYLKKHPDDEPAKEKAPQSDVDRLMEGLNAESIRKLREYAELLLLGQDAQTAPTAPDIKTPPKNKKPTGTL